jgi:Kef-type K+ transport system membrane component KefB
VVTEFQPIQILVDFFIMLAIGNLVILFSKKLKFSPSLLLLITGILLSPNTFGLNILGNSGILFFFPLFELFLRYIRLSTGFSFIKNS